MTTINQTDIEVRYQETDQMGVVYHANYLVWFEIGRTKLIQQLGFHYASLEEENILSPVIDVQISYQTPAKYGDTVTVSTWIHSYDGVRTSYGYEIHNKDGERLVKGTTQHVIVDKTTFKPMRLRSVNRAWHLAYKKELKGDA